MSTDLKIKGDEVVVTEGKLRSEEGFVGRADDGKFFFSTDVSSTGAATLRLRAHSDAGADIVVSSLTGPTGGTVTQSVYGHDGLFTHSVSCHDATVANRFRASDVRIGQVPTSGEEAPGGSLRILNEKGEDAFVCDGAAGTAFLEAGLVIHQNQTDNPPKPVLSHSPAHPGWGLWYRDEEDAFVFQRAGAPVMTVGLGEGRIGIGTDAPQHALHVEGTIAGRQMVNLSDAACKSDVTPISEALSLVEDIEGVSFKWRDSAKTGGERNFGFLAQDLEDVVPEVVSEFADGKKGVAYAALVPILVEAVKELATKVRDLQRQGAGGDASDSEVHTGC